MMISQKFFYIFPIYFEIPRHNFSPRKLFVSYRLCFHFECVSYKLDLLEY